MSPAAAKIELYKKFKDTTQLSYSIGAMGGNIPPHYMVGEIVIDTYTSWVITLMRA